MPEQSSYKNPFQSDEKPTKNKEALESIRGPQEQPQPTGSSGNEANPNEPSSGQGSDQPEQLSSPENANFSRVEGGAGYAPPPPEPSYQRAVQQIQEPGGWKKLTSAVQLTGETALGYLNKVREFNGAQPLGVPASFEQPQMSPLDIVPGGAVLKTGAKTAVKQAAKVGVKKKAAQNSAERIATNAATEKATASWLTKYVNGLKSPGTLGRASAGAVVGSIVGAIGSYPFAGFIREEALQTLSFATRTAIQNNDLEGADEALNLQEETLNPDLWDKIIYAIPFANVVAELNDFYDAARLKVKIDRKLVRDMRASSSNEASAEGEAGLNRDAYFQQIREEEEEEERAIIDYYNQERKRLLEWENQAKSQAREEEAEFWRQQREEKAQQEAADREAQAKFWLAYRKRLQEISDNNRPSNLNFGLI